MFISDDKRLLLLCVPKTGAHTLTATFPLKNLLTLVPNKNNHETYSQFCGKFGSYASSLEKVYLFWRDPVKRFISSINYIKSEMHAFEDYHEAFFDIKFITSINSYGGTFTENVLKATPEQMFQNRRIMKSIHFLPQSNWYKDVPKEKLHILNFDNFEIHVRNLLTEYGFDPNVEIKKMNESQKITTSLSAEMEAKIKEYYAEDYTFKPDF